MDEPGDAQLEGLIAAVNSAELAARQSHAVTAARLKELSELFRLQQRPQRKSSDCEQDFVRQPSVASSLAAVDSEDLCAAAQATTAADASYRAAAADEEAQLNQLQAKKSALEQCLQRLSITLSSNISPDVSKRVRREVLDKVWGWLDSGSFNQPPDERLVAVPPPVLAEGDKTAAAAAAAPVATSVACVAPSESGAAAGDTGLAAVAPANGLAVHEEVPAGPSVEPTPCTSSVNPQPPVRNGKRKSAALAPDGCSANTSLKDKAQAALRVADAMLSQHLHSSADGCPSSDIIVA